MEKNKKTLAVIGLGYVGLPLALLADKNGYKVYGIDTDEEKVKKINSKSSPFKDEAISEKLKDASLLATSDFKKIGEAEIIAICVPTPVYEDHTPNLEPVKSVCAEIAPYLRIGQLVILESTVNPGVSEEVVLPILEEISGLKAGEDFYLAHCPERINPGDGKWSVANIPRVVGSLEERGLEMALHFYRSIISAGIRPMGSLKEAESVKIVENSFRDVNIAFVNELAMSFSKLGIDITNVIAGASTKPFAYMPHFPGCGVGGHCIPVDPYYLIEYAHKNGFEHHFLRLARRINNYMPEFTVERVAEALNEKKIPLNGSKVVVLGLAYKGDIDDTRESPSFDIIKSLKRWGAEVSVFDPYIPDKSTAKSLEEALKGADAVILATPHSAFKEITPAFLSENKVGVLVDGRNFFAKDDFLEAGIVYKGIGR